MRRKFLILCGCLLIGSMTSMAFGEEVFEPVNVVYMKNGKAIRCRIGWLEGTKMVCQKFNGTVSLPLQSINLEKTFPKFKKRDGETVLLVHPGEVYRDEHIAVSNVRMIREGPNHSPSITMNPSRSHYALLCDVMNIQEKKIEGPAEAESPENTREEKIRALKEHFLKERPQSSGP